MDVIELKHGEAPGKSYGIVKKILKVFGRVLLTILCTVFIIVAGLVGVVYTINRGPSPTARDIFVQTVLETSALKFLSNWFIPPEKVDEILESNKVMDMDMVTNPELVVIKNVVDKSADGNNANIQKTATEEEIEIIPVSGLTFTGKAMIIKDPSRVKVGVCKNINKADKRGDHLIDFFSKLDIIAAINAGGFYDPNGNGTGSIPDGILISDGVLYSGKNDSSYLVIGFDNNNVLNVGYMKAKKALEIGIRDAVSFSPALIINGEAADVSGKNQSLNPRTGIGQREDGAVVFLVIDGRQPNSLGATYSDMIELFQELGCINAANLDGGSSSLMYYKGELVSNKTSLTGDRPIPDCFYVERRPEDD